jgi:hypothetical protein
MAALYSSESSFNFYRLEKKFQFVHSCFSRIFRTIMLPVVLYGCETWSLALREEHRLRVFENRMLRGIFGSKRDEATGGWRKLHNEELHRLYSSPSQGG